VSSTVTLDVLNYDLFTDNDGHPPTVWTRPATRQPMRFKIGTITITYVAADATRHKAKCNFSITIEGKKSSFLCHISTHTLMIITVSTASS
jgi:hypothetical protein